jgi:hypothetical protein
LNANAIECRLLSQGYTKAQTCAKVFDDDLGFPKKTKTSAFP